MRACLQTAVGFLIWILSVPPDAKGTGTEAPLPAQHPIIRSWGTGSGLPQNTVNAIAQTIDGYLWLGTLDGLARFDGIRFKVFGLEHGLPSVSISALFADQQNVLWIGTAGSGLCKLARGRFEIVPSSSSRPGSDTVNCIEEDSTGKLWVGTVGGLRFYRNKELFEDDAFGSVSRAPVLSLCHNRDNSVMWVSSIADGLFKYEYGRLEPCAGPPGHEKIIGEAMFQDHEGRLWVGIGNGMVLRQDGETWRMFNEADGLPFAYITSFAEDSSGSIWAGSLDAGLYRFDGAHFNLLKQRDGLSAEDIRSLYCDHEGGLCIGTRTGGLNRLSGRKLAAAGSDQGLTNDYTRSVAQTSDGAIWVGTVGGSLFRGSPSNFESFRPADNRVYYYATVLPVLKAPDDSLWWGAKYGLLHWKNGQLADCITNEPWVRNAAITALQNDGRGGMWVGTSAGHLLHKKGRRFTEFPLQFTRAVITSLAQRPDGSLWVGTAASGLKLISEASNSVLTMTAGLSSNSSINTLYFDTNGALWIGTAGAGLNCWRGGAMTRFGAQQGLAPHTVLQIVEDDFGALWLGCGNGIFQVNKRDLFDVADGKAFSIHARSFGVNDGMPAEECSGGFCPAGLKTKSGLICISTVKGLVFLDPKRLREEPPPPKAVLEEAILGGREQVFEKDKTNGASQPLRLRLAPGMRDLELHYTAISLSAPDKIGFRYKLEPSDQNWTAAEGRRVAYFQRLAPNDYMFHVQACNADGVWNESDTSLFITVLPYFWETGLFRAAAVTGLATLLGGVGWLILRRRYQLHLARLETVNAIQRERLRISKDMHDHVGSVLTQVSQLTDLGMAETGDKQAVETRLQRIGNRARVAVQSLDEIVWATNPRNDSLASFAEYVSRFCDEFFDGTHIRCWQEVPNTYRPMPLRAEVRHNVFLAVQEALHNSLKHSKATEVWLRMGLVGKQLTVEIEDNGCGFNPAKSPRGNGLENMQTRLADCAGEALVKSNPGRGTSVRFSFPISS